MRRLAARLIQQLQRVPWHALLRRDLHRELMREAVLARVACGEGDRVLVLCELLVDEHVLRRGELRPRVAERPRQRRDEREDEQDEQDRAEDEEGARDDQVDEGEAWAGLAVGPVHLGCP